MYILVEKQRDFQYEMSLVDCYQLKQQDEYVVESMIVEKMTKQWSYGGSCKFLKEKCQCSGDMASQALY
jgi:hypothetical protein